MQDMLSFFSFNGLELSGLVGLLLSFMVSAYFYIVYYSKPAKYGRRESKNNDDLNLDDLPSVSVIIDSENEAGFLANHLPSILDQDYPDFEVIVVNKGSTDESDDVLQALSVKHPNLYHTFIPITSDKLLSDRKLALTVGIKAAKNDVLLFTESYSCPMTNKWVVSMVKDLKDEKQIALGYSSFKKTDSSYDRIARFDNLLFSLQYMSMSIKNQPFTGTYRNLAFKRSLFFDNKGFSSCLGLLNGEEVFVNRVLNSDNTVVVAEQDAFTETDVYNFYVWRQIKKAYSFARYNFKGMKSRKFRVEYASRYLFYTSFLALMAYGVLMENMMTIVVALGVFLLRYLMQVVVINRASGYFRAGKFYLSLPILELIQPLFNVRFRSRQGKRSLS